MSVKNTNLSHSQLDNLKEIVSKLFECTSNSQANKLNNVLNTLNKELNIQRLESSPVVSYESKQSSLGMEYFDTLHDAIVNKKVLCIGYFSSRSNNIMQIIFYPFYLKEYKGRWFAFGYKEGMSSIYKLPLDRIRDYSYSILPFQNEYNFNPDKYFRNIIGVTKLSGEIKEITFLVKNRLAPYIHINPIHHSQMLQSKQENGDYIFTINIIPNREFYNLITEYQPYITVLSPRDIGLEVNSIFMEKVKHLPDYNKTIQEVIPTLPESWDNTLFSDIQEDLEIQTNID